MGLALRERVRVIGVGRDLLLIPLLLTATIILAALSGLGVVGPLRRRMESLKYGEP
jgi:hypothetical protein